MCGGPLRIYPDKYGYNKGKNRYHCLLFALCKTYLACCSSMLVLRLSGSKKRHNDSNILLFHKTVVHIHTHTHTHTHTDRQEEKQIHSGTDQIHEDGVTHRRDKHVSSSRHFCVHIVLRQSSIQQKINTHWLFCVLSFFVGTLWFRASPVVQR